MKDVEIRKATAEDVKAFYPEGLPTNSAYVWVAIYKGELACIAGLTVSRFGAVAFSDLKPIAKTAPKRVIWETAKQLFAEIKGLGLPMITAADPCLKGSKEFLERLGFTHVGPRYGKEVFSCKPQH